MATANDHTQTTSEGNGVLPSDPAEVTECPERGTVLAAKGKVLSYLVRKQAVNHSQEDYKQIRDHIDAPNDTVNEAIRELVADVNQFHFVASPGGHRDVLVITSSQYLSTARDWAEALDPDFDPDVVDGWSPDTGPETVTCRFVCDYDDNGLVEEWVHRSDDELTFDINYAERLLISVQGSRGVVEDCIECLRDISGNSLPPKHYTITPGKHDPAPTCEIVVEHLQTLAWVQEVTTVENKVGVVIESGYFEELQTMVDDDIELTVVESDGDNGILKVAVIF